MKVTLFLKVFFFVNSYVCLMCLSYMCLFCLWHSCSFSLSYICFPGVWQHALSSLHSPALRGQWWSLSCGRSAPLWSRGEVRGGAASGEACSAWCCRSERQSGEFQQQDWTGWRAGQGTCLNALLTIAGCWNSKSQYVFLFFNYLAQLEEAKKKANQVTKSSENLSNQIQQTRDELETDLKDTGNVVKDLRDFLSGRSHFS